MLGVWHLAAADFDEDSWLDVVGVSMVDAQIGVHFYRENRTFSLQRLPPLPIPGGHFVATGDFDSDRHQDIAVGMGPEIAVAFGRGDGTFGDLIGGQLRVRGIPVGCHRCRSADLTKDGRSDLLAIGESFVLIYHGSALNRESGLPDEPSALLDLEGTGRFLEIADMNSDGALDVVTQGVENKTILQVFWGTLGEEEGTRFDAGTPFYSTVSSHGSLIAVGDLNHDDALDIVVTTEDTNKGQVFLNDAACASLTAEAGDVNADGAVNLADPVAILAHLFAEQPLRCPGAAEVNGDDQFDMADAVYILQFLFLEGPPLIGGGPRPCAAQ
jgi:hypothetical protein